MNQLYLYIENITSRIQYVVGVLEVRWGCRIQLTDDFEYFKKLNHPKINYSEYNISSPNIQIQPQGLLSQREIGSFDFCELERDPLAFMFFLLSRYEEYVVLERDIHDRFPANASYLYKTNRLQKAVVDRLINDLKQKIQHQFPTLKFKKAKYDAQFTIDIDQAYKFQHKSFKRFIGANIRDAIRLNFSSIIERKLTYLYLKKDPWNIYQKFKLESKHKKTQPTIFFLIGDLAANNKNLSFKNSAFQKVIRAVDSWATVGLHPSYGSYKDLNKVNIEKKRLEDIVNHSIIYSRQHYIQCSLPETYHCLIQAGITHDYSMGYAEDVGFRAGTALPFLWYDLKNDKVTNLKIHPFCAMDVTLKNYLNLTIPEANQILDDLKDEVQKVNGTFCIITHNESLSGSAEWKGWGDMLINYWE
ncbi:MAG: polysaccharide deacetylase family protein [Weeksellaceae bacterium]